MESKKEPPRQAWTDALRRGRLVRLNVGGEIFATSYETLTSDDEGFFAVMLTGEIGTVVDDTGAYFIDRDPSTFRHVLNFLRDRGDCELPDDVSTLRQLQREAHFYQLTSLEAAVESKLELVRNHCVLSREAVLTMVNANRGGRPLQLPRSNLSGLDLSFLDLRECIFTQSTLVNCDFRDSILTGADMRGCDARGANFTNATLSRCDLEGSSMNNTILTLALMEAVNVKNTDMSGADLTRARFRNLVGSKGLLLSQAKMPGAILNGIDLSGFDLSYCNMQGANLEETNLSGSNLTGCNLKGANLYAADLTGAIVEGAVLQAANIDRALMDDVVGSYCR